MKIDTEKVDEMLLALLYLTTFEYGGQFDRGRGTTGTRCIGYTRKD